ncbi:MarR family winged helix-turn-helix transcriptional regulator [Rhodococcus pyridinivorans]|uniref:MarR family winged helix-turn-helix transcriptional regulator n=1 Tax=Rhodococcus pyridinivorans TaxID=103816 RepID=UPI0020C69463|nr:MarR family winged helix-turn-helix transcriptional regulator [Rhodococcus pyridinivorans]UTM38018.1 MarR family winged helix-turn-helix transcriptional regulator [Rhodococcus pyridinivorans]
MDTSDVMNQRGRDSAQIDTPQQFLTMPGYVIRRLQQAYAAAWLRYVGPELTGPQFAVMFAIKLHPGVEQGSLARAAALDRSTMAGVVKRLEGRNLVLRIQPSEDGRKRLLYLTDDGAELFRLVNSRARQLDALLREGIDPVASRQYLNERADLWESLTID